MPLLSKTSLLLICLCPAGKSENCDLLFNGNCYQIQKRSFYWYDARNECLGGGGDLASLETLHDANISVSLRSLSLHSNWNYWIGLQKNEWRWQDTGQPLYLYLCFSASVSVSIFLSSVCHPLFFSPSLC